MFKYFDTHSHLHGKEFEVDRGAVLARMRAESVGTVAIGTGLKESERAVELAHKEEGVWASVGLHPVDDPKEKFNIASYRALAANPKVVAIGECGLDYFRLPRLRAQDGQTGLEVNSEKEKERQKNLFKEHIALALEVEKPLMVHCRPSPGSMDAHEDMLSLLAQSAPGLRGIIHFFTGTLEVARRYVHLGFLISFPGVITFGGEYDEVVRSLPLQYILVETDAPYAAPVPYRGKRNEPIFVKETAGYVALLRSEGREIVLSSLVKNAERVLGIV